MDQYPTEREFLETYDPAEFDRVSVTVDVVLLSIVDHELVTVVTRRDEHPDKGKWALPGGFVRVDEALDAAAARVLGAKAGVDRVFLEQLYTFGQPKRDPRMRIVSVAYYALVDSQKLGVSEDASRRIARVVAPSDGEPGAPISLVGRDGELLDTAFDHAQIIGVAIERIRGKLDYAPIGFEFLPRYFTLLDLQRVHETVLGTKLNKDSFRRRMLASRRLEDTGREQSDVGHRPAALYRFIRTLPPELEE